MSRTKKMIAIIIFGFTTQIAIIPVQNSYADGCMESATKSVITAGIVGVGLVLLDLATTGGFFTALALANAGAGAVGAGTAAGLLAAKGAVVAGTYGCVDATLWDKASTPASQLPQSARK